MSAWSRREGAFRGFLALVPLVGAIVLSYGLVAELATVIRCRETA